MKLKDIRKLVDHMLRIEKEYGPVTCSSSDLAEAYRVLPKLLAIAEAAREWLAADDDYNGGNTTPCTIKSCAVCPARETFRKLIEEGENA